MQIPQSQRGNYIGKYLGSLPLFDDALRALDDGPSYQG